MKVLQRARELELSGSKIVHMEVGEPDFPTAEPIVEAAHQALARGFTSYSNAAGITPLREAIAGHYSALHGVAIEASRVFITPGASGGLNLLSNLLVNPGDGILLSDPAYPCNRNFIRLAGGVPQLVPVDEHCGYQPTVAQLEDRRDESSSGLWLASPANPSGTVIHRERLQELVSWAAQKQLHVVADEIYQGLHFVEDMPSLLELTTGGFVVNSFSKYYGMTGWRIGWIVVPQGYEQIVDTLSQNLFIAASTIAQHAAMAAFTPAAFEIFEARKLAFRERRDFLSKALADIGFSIPHVTEGAFYLYAGIDRFADNCEVFCQDLLEHHGVAITPGTDFGDHRSRQNVRFAFTTSLQDLELGVDRLSKALAAA